MHPYLLLGLLALAALLFWNRLRHEPPAKRKKILSSMGLAALLGVLILLVATGRLPWLLALIAALFAYLRRLLPLLRYVPVLGGLITAWKRSQASPGPAPGGGGRSKVETATLRMTLDHDSGAMDGEVLEGSYAGRRLSEMELPELLDLLRYCQGCDADAEQLLTAYLERHHDDEWQRAAGDHEPHRASPGNMTMDLREAREVLGLDAHAGEEEIIAAHRRLMQKVHPDRGGSDYLATKINLAKKVLLAESGSRPA